MYGLKDYDLKNIQKKYELQKNYLKNHYFQGESGQIKSLLDVSFSANHSRRYYAEITNKINTINEIVATETIDFDKIFITVTLDGFYRDFLRADFSRYDESKHSKDIPNNERHGFLRDKIAKKEKFNIKDLYKILLHQLNGFQKSNVFKKIKKNGHNKHYIRVCEPHKADGVPHLHFMLYTPIIYRMELQKFFKKYFPAPQNLKKRTLRDKKTKKVTKTFEDGQLEGFHWEIESAPAYILKYVFKSFRNVEKDEDIDYLQAWYIKHRILRCVTSHSLIPAWVYRKMIPLEADWHYLTDIKNNAVSEWSQEDDFFRFEDEENRVLEYREGIYKIYRNDKLIKQFGTFKEKLKTRKRKNKLFTLDEISKNIIERNEENEYNKELDEEQHPKETNYNPNFVKVIIDDKEFIHTNNKLKEYNPVTPVNKRSNQSLYIDYIQMKKDDVDNFNLHHFGLVRNELIKRKFIDGDIISLNEYNTNFDYGF